MTSAMHSARPAARATRIWLACGGSALALMLGATAAHAQDANGDAEEDVITVTGSRIRTDGMQAPVPVTVVQAEEIEALSPGALISGVSQLPQFYGNQTPNSGAFFTRSGYGALNMRGLGVNRTLTLLNGRRMPSTSAFGGVDINLFPEAMLRSVETTTGGASAAYGSDAVAGVVNFILDTNYEGLELNLQGGITDRNDGENYEISAAFGTDFAGGRGHILASGEYYDQAGIHDYAGRDWYQGFGTYGAGTVADPIKYAPHMISANATLDGLINAPGTAIHGWRFSPDGSVAPGVVGSILQGTVGSAGARTAGTGIPNTAAYQDNGTEVSTLYPDLERYSAFAYVDFDVSDDFKLFGQFLHGRTSIFSYNSPRGGFGVPQTALTIFSGNPYLPANLQTAMTQNNIASFNLRREGTLLDVGQMYLDDTTTQYVGTAGFEYEVAGDGFLGGWGVNGFYQYGTSTRNWKQLGLRVDRIFAAVDAVRDPNNAANIVCRVSTFSGGAAAFPGCQPVNLFGRGGGTAATPAGYDYVVGFEPGQTINTNLYFAGTGLDPDPYSFVTQETKVNLTTFNQHFAELAFAGDLIDLWAGPVSLAFGGSYRHDGIFQRVQDVANPTSNHDNFRPVRCSDAAIGLRGVAAGDCGNTVGNQFSKVSNIRGSAEVWEAFGEVLLPLYDSDDFTAAANGAFRWADYSGSGTIWAYKGGVEFGLLDSQLRLRSTFSQDVRAGNLSERFDKTGGFANVDDPRIAGTDSTGVTTVSGGNPLVDPEVAKTFTAGLVYRPDWLSGLSFSLDYYNIRIKDAISRVGTQRVLNACFQDQAQEYCDLIELTDGNTATPASTAALSIVGDQFVNVARATVEGLDIEASYTTDLTLLGGDETLGFRGFGSWLISRTDTTAPTPTDPNGVTSNFAGQVGGGLPYADFKATASLTYRNGPFDAMIQARYLDGGLQNACGQPGRCSTATTGTSQWLNNHVPSVTYLDLRLGYDFELAGTEMALSFNLSNLTDEAPPITPGWTALAETASQYNSSLYDVLGRRYTLGLRVKM